MNTNSLPYRLFKGLNGLTDNPKGFMGSVKYYAVEVSHHTNWWHAVFIDDKTPSLLLQRHPGIGKEVILVVYGQSAEFRQNARNFDELKTIHHVMGLILGIAEK